jgi:hypothetical protein
MSYQAEVGRLLIALAAIVAGFLVAPGFEPCGPRLLSLAIGPGIAVLVFSSAAARIMRFDAFGAIVFIILAAVFVYFAGPAMHQCRPGF